LDDSLEELHGLGDYNITWKVLDTKEQGIPQSRRRWYCVGIRKDVDDGSFSRDPELATSGLHPTTQTIARKNVETALLKIERDGHDGRRVT